MRDRTAKFLSRIHTALYQTTSGVVGSRLVDNDMLLLTTTGRHTGKAHTVPLLYLLDDGRFVVFASWGGRVHHPEWYLNLLAHPHGVVQVRSRRQPVTAMTAEGDEREHLWARAEAAYSGYAEYQAKTDRRIPVVLLVPD
jgi:F420H(2)-dependent quinone reductase